MNNHIFYPSIKGSENIERREIQLARELLLLNIRLKREGLVNTGNKTAILCSNTDGYGLYNASHRIGSLNAGLKHLFNIGRKKAALFEDATSHDLKRVIRNPDFGSIYVIGHGTYHSWRASDKSVNWHDVGCMIDSHLKNGVFVNLSCGIPYSWNFIPLGYFAVNNPENVYGIDRNLATEEDLSHLSRFKQLRSPKIILDLESEIESESGNLPILKERKNFKQRVMEFLNLSF